MKKLNLLNWYTYVDYTTRIQEISDYENLFWDYKEEFPEIGSEWLLQTGNGAFTIEDDIFSLNALTKYANDLLEANKEEKRLPYNFENEGKELHLDEVAKVIMKYSSDWEEPAEEDYEYIKGWIDRGGI